MSYLKVTSEQGYDHFQQLLNSGSDTARMEQLNTDSLPVLDDKHHFVGTAERGKLTSSLILSVTDKLEGRNAGTP